jgi:hypothetical protein
MHLICIVRGERQAKLEAQPSSTCVSKFLGITIAIFLGTMRFLDVVKEERSSVSAGVEV